MLGRCSLSIIVPQERIGNEQRLLLENDPPC
jgi:hypothetical protein